MSVFTADTTAESFMITALLSGLGAGIIATIATIAIERFGGHLGGVIGTLPTTIIPASWGLWSRLIDAEGRLSPKAHSEFALSMYAVPAGMVLNALFLWLWRALPSSLPQEWSRLTRSTDTRSRWMIVSVMSILTLGAWSLGASLWVWTSHVYLVTASSRQLAALIATALIIVLGLWATYHRRPAPRGARPVAMHTLITRGACACIAVGGAVVISQSGASTLAGVASVFPAIFWTTMVSLWLSQGPSVPTGAVGPMMLGSSSVAVFALLTPWLYAEWGVALGTVFAWLIASLLISAPCYLWIIRRATR